MSEMRRIVLLRHGETEGDSSVRFHGAGDVALSEAGRGQMRRARSALAGEWFDLVVASPLQRSWRSAAIVSGGAVPVRVEADFREIDFGRWEGLTAAEIEDRDPVLHRAWQARAEGFAFPRGDKRADFVARVEGGLRRLLASGARSALLVLHKGPIRAIHAALVREDLPLGGPDLGTAIGLSRGADGRWRPGRRSSDPPGL